MGTVLRANGVAIEETDAYTTKVKIQHDLAEVVVLLMFVLTVTAGPVCVLD